MSKLYAVNMNSNGKGGKFTSKNQYTFEIENIFMTRKEEESNI